MDDAYLTLRRLAGYSGTGVRTLRDWLVDPVRPLPHYKVGGKLLVRRSEFDAWMAAYRVDPPSTVDALVNDVVRGL